MNVNKPLMVTVNNHDMEKSISLIHAQPLSSHFNSITQHMFYGHCSNNRGIKVITQATSLAVGLTTSCIAIAEVVASLAYATLATLIHLTTFCRSTSLQNHVIQSWAFCRHSFLMTLTPILLFSHSGEDSIYDVQFREHLYKINCAQAAQSIGNVFNFFACRKGKENISRAKMASVEVAIEGLTELIKETKHRMRATHDNEGNLIIPKDLPEFNQYQFVDFLKKFDNVKMNDDFNRYFTHLKLSDPNSKKFVERVVVAMAIHYRKMNPNFESEKIDQRDDLQDDDLIPMLGHKKPEAIRQNPVPQKPVQAFVLNPNLQELMDAQKKHEEEQLNNDAEFAQRLQEQLDKEEAEKAAEKKKLIDEEEKKAEEELKKLDAKILQDADEVIHKVEEKIKKIDEEKLKYAPPPKPPAPELDEQKKLREQQEDRIKQVLQDKEALEKIRKEQEEKIKKQALALPEDLHFKIKQNFGFHNIPDPMAPPKKKYDFVDSDSDSDDEDDVIQKNPIDNPPLIPPKKTIIFSRERIRLNEAMEKFTFLSSTKLFGRIAKFIPNYDKIKSFNEITNEDFDKIMHAYLNDMLKKHGVNLPAPVNLLTSQELLGYMQPHQYNQRLIYLAEDAINLVLDNKEYIDIFPVDELNFDDDETKEAKVKATIAEPYNLQQIYMLTNLNELIQLSDGHKNTCKDPKRIELLDKALKLFQQMNELEKGENEKDPLAKQKLWATNIEKLTRKILQDPAIEFKKDEPAAGVYQLISNLSVEFHNKKVLNIAIKEYASNYKSPLDLPKPLDPEKPVLDILEDDDLYA